MRGVAGCIRLRPVLRVPSFLPVFFPPNFLRPNTRKKTGNKTLFPSLPSTTSTNIGVCKPEHSVIEPWPQLASQKPKDWTVNWNFRKSLQKLHWRRGGNPESASKLCAKNTDNNISFGFLQYLRFHNVLKRLRLVHNVEMTGLLPNFDSFKVGKLELKVVPASKWEESVEYSGRYSCFKFTVQSAL